MAKIWRGVRLLLLEGIIESKCRHLHRDTVATDNRLFRTPPF